MLPLILKEKILHRKLELYKRLAPFFKNIWPKESTKKLLVPNARDIYNIHVNAVNLIINEDESFWRTETGRIVPKNRWTGRNIFYLKNASQNPPKEKRRREIF